MISRVTMRSLVATALVGAAVLSAGAAPGALNAYLVLSGQKQGPINGTVTEKGREKSIAITGFSHSIVSPRDPQSGLPTGRRKTAAVGSITVTKTSDTTSSQLMRRAIATNEVMATAVIDGPNVWGPDPNDRVTAKLEDAMIDSCVPATAPPPGQPETCTITYTAVSLVHLATPTKPPERITR